ncbi:hypothetical protein D3C78_18470 [compost metagenome]
MQISAQGVFWTFVITLVTTISVAVISAEVQEARLNTLLDNAISISETSGGLVLHQDPNGPLYAGGVRYSSETIDRIYTMAKKSGFSGTLLQIYDRPEGLSGDASLTYSVACYKEPVYLELRYPSIPLWHKAMQMVGLAGKVPGTDERVAFKWGISQVPTYKLDNNPPWGYAGCP